MRPSGMSDDVEISRKYRQLEAAEPPRALDEAILAAARREAGAGPSSLQARAARGGRQRWYAPLATAAVLVLAVAVTLNMQLERPGIESPAPQAVRQQTAPPAAPAPTAVAKEEATPKVAAKAKPAPARAAAAAREPQPFAAPQAPAHAAGGTGELVRRMEERSSRDAAEADSRAPQVGAAQSLAKRAPRAEVQEKLQAAKPGDTPERELERIAELRAQGRHEEADKALAEFRKRHPEFRIPEVTRERVERR